MLVGKERLHEYLGPLVPLLALFDVLAVLAGAVVAFVGIDVVRPQYGIGPESSQYQIAVLLAIILAPSALSWLGGYKAWRGQSLFAEIRLVVMAWVVVFLFLSGVALVTKTGGQYSRIWLGLWSVSALGFLILSRVGLRLGLRALRRRGIDVKRLVIAGNGGLLRIVIKAIKANPSCGLKVHGYFSDEMVGGVPIEYLGQIESLPEFIRKTDLKVDQLWVAMPMSDEAVLSKLLAEIKHSTIDIRMVPDMFAYQLLNHSVEQIAGLPVINISYSPYSGAEKYLKDITDKLLALGIIALLSPIMLSVAALIRLTSPGPVLFRQLRHGWDGKPFNVYKFRTMKVEYCVQTAEYRQAKREDDRTTTIGKILRKTSLDELPQFFNVLHGDMSIVGPRPHPVEMNYMYMDSVDRYMLRHKVKPGITGWAQVNGYRGETDTIDKIEQRIQHDLYYIENWSIRFDIMIMLLTVFRGLWGKNAF